MRAEAGVGDHEIRPGTRGALDASGQVPLALL